MKSPQKLEREGIPLREFARLDGCHESLVRRGISQGRIKRFSDGSVDPSFAGKGWRENNRRHLTAADSHADTTADSPQNALNVRTNLSSETAKSAAFSQIRLTEDDPWTAGYVGGLVNMAEILVSDIADLAKSCGVSPSAARALDTALRGKLVQRLTLAFDQASVSPVIHCTTNEEIDQVRAADTWAAHEWPDIAAGIVTPNFPVDKRFLKKNA